jgi:hypothetical protein
MKCIFCMLEKRTGEFTVEHAFPEAIGGSFKLKDCVCKDCNSTLGSDVDVHLTDHYLIQFHRLLHRIPGKSGKIPNPLENSILSGNNPQKVKYFFDEKGKPKELYLTPLVKRNKQADGSTKISISIDHKDEADLPKILQKIIDREGQIGKLTVEDMLKSYKREKIENPLLQINEKIDMINYKRSILKIAYELAYYWLGPSYIDDPSAQLIRRAIIDQSDPNVWGDKYKIHGSIGLCKELNIVPFRLHLETSHIAFLQRTKNDIVCYIRIFAVFEGVIKISESAQSYPHFQDSFLAIETLPGNIREMDIISGFAYLNDN